MVNPDEVGTVERDGIPAPDVFVVQIRDNDVLDNHVAAPHPQPLALDGGLTAHSEDGLVAADVDGLSRSLPPGGCGSVAAVAALLDDLLEVAPSPQDAHTLPDSVPSDSVESYSLERVMTRGSSSVRSSVSSSMSFGVTAATLPPPVTPVAKPSTSPDTVWAAARPDSPAKMARTVEADFMV